MIKPKQSPLFLRESSPTNSQPINYPLSSNKTITIGQDRNLQIVLDAAKYPGIASRHVEISPVGNGSSQWQICDLGSTNGTYINNQQLQGCRILQIGDCITLGQQGTQFVFEAQSSPILKPLKQSVGDSLHLSVMLPIIGVKDDLLQKGFLIPGIVTVLTFVGLFKYIGDGQNFNKLLSTYLLSGSYYFVYKLCGKSKPWWLLFCVALMTFVLIESPVIDLFFFIFRNVLPGNNKGNGFFNALVGNFFGAGLLEELFKALPVFLALAVGKKLKSPWKERIGVWEPIDGVLLATASAAGFIFYETVFQYSANATAQMGELAGLQLLIPRMINGIAGHIAYSGYFGYFIGLSVLKPTKRWQLLAIGYLTSATIHAFWNASGQLGALGKFVQILVGVVAYTFLISAILKARKLSPNRASNTATQYLNYPSPSPITAPAPIQTSIQAPFYLQIQGQKIPLNIGTQLSTGMISGLIAQTNGIIAEISVNPKDPSILGLKNCSHQTWVSTSPAGVKAQIDPSRNMKLAVGMRINFGSVTGDIS